MLFINAYLISYINTFICIHSKYLNKHKPPSNGVSPVILSSPFASCSLINLDFSLPQTSQFDKSIIHLGFFIFTALGFLLSVSFYTSSNKIRLLCIWFKYLISHQTLKFFLLYHHILLAHYLLKQIYFDYYFNR